MCSGLSSFFIFSILPIDDLVVTLTKSGRRRLLAVRGLVSSDFFEKRSKKPKLFLPQAFEGIPQHRIPGKA